MGKEDQQWNGQSKMKTWPENPFLWETRGGPAQAAKRLNDKRQNAIASK
jgi:hypothetical protein